MKQEAEWRPIEEFGLKGKYELSSHGEARRSHSHSRVPKHIDNDGDSFFMMTRSGKNQPFMLDDLMFKTFKIRASKNTYGRGGKYVGKSFVPFVSKKKEPFSLNEDDYAREEDRPHWEHMVRELKENYKIMRRIKNNETFDDSNLESF